MGQVQFVLRPVQEESMVALRARDRVHVRPRLRDGGRERTRDGAGRGAVDHRGCHADFAAMESSVRDQIGELDQHHHPGGADVVGDLYPGIRRAAGHRADDEDRDGDCVDCDAIGVDGDLGDFDRGECDYHLLSSESASEEEKRGW